jgi:hypothetical protein
MTMISTMTLSQTELFEAGEPGIYPGIPASVYHAANFVSNSRLKPMTRSAEHCKHAMDHGVTETDALKFGSGAHAWLLEPETLERDFIVAQQCSARVKSTGRECENTGRFYDDGEWFCGTHGKHLSGNDAPDKIVIPHTQWSEMAAIRDKVFAHRSARMILNSDGENELSIIANHGITGLTCKMRLDAYRSTYSTIADIKTCQDASRDAFERDIFKFGYYRQAGMYLRLAQQAGMNVEHFAFIAVEKKPPHAVAVYQLNDDVIEQGWTDIERLLHQYAKCQTSGNWPGYSEGVPEIGLPNYAWRELLDTDSDSE